MKTFGSQSMVGLVFLFLLLYSVQALAVEKVEKWPGIDESVVKKIARDHGREAREPVINTDQGDLLLFVFLLAGAVGGFVAGYYWRRLITEKATHPNRTEDLKGPQGTLH
jgi:hypothetical protein